MGFLDLDTLTVSLLLLLLFDCGLSSRTTDISLLESSSSATGRRISLDEPVFVFMVLPGLTFAAGGSSSSSASSSFVGGSVRLDSSSLDAVFFFFRGRDRELSSGEDLFKDFLLEASLGALAGRFGFAGRASGRELGAAS